MDHIIIIEPCIFTRLALNVKLKERNINLNIHALDIPLLAAKRNIGDIFNHLQNQTFSTVILGNINPVFGPQAMIQFTLGFQRVYGESKKLIHFSDQPQPDILSKVLGLNVELVDTCSAPDVIEKNITNIINDPSRGFISAINPLLLSEKQREVMRYCFQNISMVELAALIGENPKTLCVHKRRAMKKLGITHLSHLLSLSQEQKQIITSDHKGNSE